MPRVRDSQYSKARSAVWSVQNGRSIRGPKARRAYIEKLISSKWFRRHFLTYRTDVVHRTRWIKCERHVLYILAYCVRERKGVRGAWAFQLGADHGREFAHVYRLLVGHVFGKDAERTLVAKYRELGVRYTAPRPPRTIAPLELAAMRARLDGARAKKAARATPIETTIVGERCIQCGKLYVPGDPIASHTESCKWFGVAEG